MVSFHVGPRLPSLFRSAFAASCCCQPLPLLCTSFAPCAQCVLSSLDLLQTFLLSLSPQMLPAFSTLPRSCICYPFILLPCSFSLVTLLVPLLLPVCQTCTMHLSHCCTACSFALVISPALSACDCYFISYQASSFSLLTALRTPLACKLAAAMQLDSYSFP